MCDQAGGLKQRHLFACGRAQHPGGKGQTWWGGGCWRWGEKHEARWVCWWKQGAGGTGWVSTSPLLLLPYLLAPRFQMRPSLKGLLMVRPICLCK